MVSGAASIYPFETFLSLLFTLGFVLARARRALRPRGALNEADEGDRLGAPAAEAPDADDLYEAYFHRYMLPAGGGDAVAKLSRAIE